MNVLPVFFYSRFFVAVLVAACISFPTFATIPSILTAQELRANELGDLRPSCQRFVPQLVEEGLLKIQASGSELTLEMPPRDANFVANVARMGEIPHPWSSEVKRLYEWVHGSSTNTGGRSSYPNSLHLSFMCDQNEHKTYLFGCKYIVVPSATANGNAAYYLGHQSSVFNHTFEAPENSNRPVSLLYYSPRNDLSCLISKVLMGKYCDVKLEGISELNSEFKYDGFQILREASVPILAIQTPSQIPSDYYEVFNPNRNPQIQSPFIYVKDGRIFMTRRFNQSYRRHEGFNVRSNRGQETEFTYLLATNTELSLKREVTIEGANRLVDGVYQYDLEQETWLPIDARFLPVEGAGGIKFVSPHQNHSWFSIKVQGESADQRLIDALHFPFTPGLILTGSEIADQWNYLVSILPKLSSLEILRLQKASRETVTDPNFITALQSCLCMQEVDFSDSDLTDDDLVRLQRGFGRLKVLKLNRNVQLTPTSLQTLRGLTALQALDVTGCYQLSAFECNRFREGLRRPLKIICDSGLVQLELPKDYQEVPGDQSRLVAHLANHDQPGLVTYRSCGFIMRDGTYRVCGATHYGSNSQGHSHEYSTWHPNVVILNWFADRIEGLNTQIAKVCHGYSQTHVITKDGDVWGWGYNGHGQLGNGTTANLYTPVPIQNVIGPKARQPRKVIKILNSSSAAHEASCIIALCEDGSVWSWGYNGYGQLATGNTQNQSIPKQMYMDNNQPILNVVDIFAYGGKYPSVFCVKSDGTIWATGNNAHGQLGVGDTINKNHLTLCKLDSEYHWYKAEGAGAYVLHNNWNGSGTTLFLSREGRLVSCGYNPFGQLGDGNVPNTSSEFPRRHWMDKKDNFPSIPTPQPVILADGTTQPKVKNVWAFGGGYTSCYATDEHGDFWSWGYNNCGQLGINSTTNSKPQRASSDTLGRHDEGSLGAPHIVAMAATDGCYQDLSVAVLSKDGKVWVAGYNGNGQLGLGDTNNSLTWKRVFLPNNKPVLEVRGFGDSSKGAFVYLDEEGRAYAVGYNGAPQSVSTISMASIAIHNGDGMLGTDPQCTSTYVLKQVFF